jgi:glycosyltransferase involved in cell wall biosynthesis
LKQAIVIHPRFTLYGGGEVVGLHVCKALQELGYHVFLACDVFSPEETERHLGLGAIMNKCTHVPVTKGFKPARIEWFLAYQRAIYTVRFLNSIRIPKNCEFVFSTQYMFYFKRNLLNFCIAYELADFYSAHEMSPNGKMSLLKAAYYYPLRRLYRYYETKMLEKERFFIPLSRTIEQSMEALHYPHSRTVLPPCEMSFRVRPKKKYVVNTSRLVPSKRLEDFANVARRLPDYDFVIVGKMSKTEEVLFPSYRQALFDCLPPNVKLVEGLLRDRKELLETAKVYLYPSVELGASISLGQAMGAGCIAVTPSIGGGAEMVEAAGTGYTYRSLEDAPDVVKRALESNAPQDSPERIAESAKIFSSDSFEEKIKRIVQERVCTDPRLSPIIRPRD